MASQSGHNKLASTNGIKQADSQELLKNNLELISDHCGTNNSAQHEESEKSWMAHGQQNSSGLYSGTTENFDPQQASVIQPPPSIGSVHTTDYNVLPEDTKKTTDQNTCSVEKSSVMRDTVRPNLDRMEGDVQLSNVCRPSDNNQITNSFSDIEEKSVQFLNFGQHSSEADSTKCCLAKTTSSNVHQISISKSTINTSDHIENKNSDPSTVVNKANSFIDSAECKSVTELCTKLGNKLSCVTNTGCDGAPDICKSESEIVDESLSCLVTNSENEPKTLVENIDCLETIENDAQHLSVTKYVSKHENTSECNGNIIFNKPQGDLRLHDFTERNTNSCHIEEKDIFQRKSLSSIDECSTKSSNKFSEGNINSAPKFLDGESIGVTSSIPKANVFPHDFVPSQNFVSENKEMLADISGHENFQGLRCTMTKIDKNDNAASNAESMQQINAGKRSRCPNVKEIVRKIKSARTSKPLGITSGHNSTFCGESETATEKISSSFSAKTLQKEAVGSDNSKIEPCEMVSDGSLLNDGLSPQKECQASKLEIQKLNDLKNYDVGSAKLDAASILNDQNLEPKAKDEMDKCIHFRECSKVEEKSTLDEFTWQSCITSTDNLKSTNGQQSCRNELPLNTPSPKNHQQFGMSFSNNTWKKENAQVNEALEKPTLSHADASGHSSVLIDAHTNIVQPRPHKEINVGGGRKFLYEGAPKAVGANNSETVECSSDVLPTLKNHENGDPLIITPAVLNLATEVSEGHLTFQQAVDSLTKPPKKLKVSERLGRKVDKPKIKNRLGNVVPLDDATPLAFNPYSYPYTGARDKQYGQSKFLFPESSSDIPIEIPPAKRNYFQAFSGEVNINNLKW